MNTAFRIIPVLALAWATTALAQDSRPAGMDQLRVKHQDLPIFPHELIRLGVREGRACVAFSVNTAGQVDDCLAVAYTHREFAEATIAVVRRWTFEPARFRGEPVAAAADVIVNFELQGPVVVSLTSAEVLANWVSWMHRNNEGYFPRTLRELDAIPAPIAAPSPEYSERLAQRGVHGNVTVKFYIDETGRVRLPAVDSADNWELSGLAISALNRWKFEPPLCKGVPVLVKASQVFRFRPTPAAGKAPG